MTWLCSLNVQPFDNSAAKKYAADSEDEWIFSGLYL